MIRVLYFLIVVGALSLGIAWLADRPGEVVVTWQGWRIETSLLVLGAAMVAVLGAAGAGVGRFPRRAALAVHAAQSAA